MRYEALWTGCTWPAWQARQAGRLLRGHRQQALQRLCAWVRRCGRPPFGRAPCMATTAKARAQGSPRLGKGRQRAMGLVQRSGLAATRLQKTPQGLSPGLLPRTIRTAHASLNRVTSSVPSHRAAWLRRTGVPQQLQLSDGCFAPGRTGCQGQGLALRSAGHHRRVFARRGCAGARRSQTPATALGGWRCAATRVVRGSFQGAATDGGALGA